MKVQEVLGGEKILTMNKIAYTSKVIYEFRFKESKIGETEV